MSFLEHSNMMLEQSLVEIKNAFQDYKDAKIDIETFTGLLERAAIAFQERQGTRSDLELFDIHEPPLSAKVNRILRSMSSDVLILARQIDLLRAATVMAFNIINTETQTEKNEVSRLKGMVKTASLYNEETGHGVLVWFESFENQDRFLENLAFPLEISGDTLHLGRTNAQVVSKDMSLSIEKGSSGFKGAFFEYTGKDGPLGPTVFGEKDPHDRLEHIRDTNPSTWFEYEAAYLPPDQRERVQRKGFRYLNSKSVRINWAKGPLLNETNKDINRLRMVLLCTLPALERISHVSLVPYWGKNGKFKPFLVRKVEISPDGENWTKLSPESVQVSRVITLKRAQKTQTTVKEPHWVFPAMPTKFIRFLLIQDETYRAKIIVPLQLDKKGRAIENHLASTTDRAKPFVSPPASGTTIKRVKLKGDKWGIGLADISASKQDYLQQGEKITKPIHFPNEVDRVSVSALIDLPPSFVSEDDPAKNQWVEFYISHDQGSTWTRILPQEQPNIGIPEVIAFNDSTPLGFRDKLTTYVDTASPVTSLMVKIAMKRPADNPGETPTIREGFKLKVILKEK